MRAIHKHLRGFLQTEVYGMAAILTGIAIAAACLLSQLG
jgi:hypothetical protein